MPPKPFNPPRPTTSTSNATSKKPGRPKGSTSSKPTSAIKKKSTASTKPATKGKQHTKPRLSTASARSLLPSLSPDTAPSDLASPTPSQTDSSDPFASQPLPPSKPTTKTPHPRPQSPNLTLDSEPEQEHLDGRKEKIPDGLLSAILHEMFRKEGTRMSRDAVGAVAKYMDTFVREGIARAAWAGEGGLGDEGGWGNGGVLEVEDLERLAPQLLLDF